MVEDVVGHQRLLSSVCRGAGRVEKRKKEKLNKHQKRTQLDEQVVIRERRPLYLVRDVLLLCGGVTLWVDESGVGHQVASVLHDEAPAK